MTTLRSICRRLAVDVVPELEAFWAFLILCGVWYVAWVATPA